MAYHKIGPKQSLYWTTAEDFRAQMRELKAKGYTAITLPELFNFRAGIAPPPLKPLVITFDDAYENVLTDVAPVLADPAINYKATCFVPTVRVGGTNAWDEDSHPIIRHLTWNEIESLQRSGRIDFQSHTVTHCHMTDVSAAAMYKELLDSRIELQCRLRKPVEVRELALWGIQS